MEASQDQALLGDGRRPWCCTRLFRSIRQSEKTAVVVMFLAFMLDMILVAVVEPVLPDILRSNTSDSSGESPDNASTPGTGRHGNGSNSNMPYFPARGEHSVNPIMVGVLNGAKPITQVVFNPLVGYITDRCGSTIPMAVGFILAIVSTLGFAYLNSYALLVAARCLQGLGSGLITVSETFDTVFEFCFPPGLSMLATLYQDPEERGKAMNIAYSGLAVGLIVGFPLGSSLYQFAGREMPFICTAVLILIGALTRFCLMPIDLNSQPKEKGKQGGPGGPAGGLLIFDVYILVAAGLYLWMFCAVGAVMGIGPLYLLEQLGAEQWQIGVLFLVTSIAECTSQYFLACWTSKQWWWLVSMLGLLLVGLSVGIFPVMGTVWLILIPFILYGTGIGLTLGSNAQQLGHLADIRSNSQYGAVYALGDSGANLGYFLGSTIAGILVDKFSYTISFVAMSVVVILYSLVSPVLWKVPEKQSSSSDADITHSDTLMENVNSVP